MIYIPFWSDIDNMVNAWEIYLYVDDLQKLIPPVLKGKDRDIFVKEYEKHFSNSLVDEDAE